MIPNLAATSTTPKLEPTLCMSSAWSSVWGNFVVHLFEGHVSLNDMDRMQAFGERWNAINPGKRAELVAVLPSGAQMSNEERARMARLIKQGEVYRSASATVIMAQGMLASVHRSVLTGMMMLAPAPHPAKVFATIADAVGWLLPHVQAVSTSAVSQADLLQAVDANLTAFRARAR